MSLGAPGRNAPAMQRLKAATAQLARIAAVIEVTSARSREAAHLSMPSQIAAGRRAESRMMVAEPNAEMGAMTVLQSNNEYILYVCIRVNGAHFIHDWCAHE
jgi:hypothetical protein